MSNESVITSEELRNTSSVEAPPTCGQMTGTDLFAGEFPSDAPPAPPGESLVPELEPRQPARPAAPVQAPPLGEEPVQEMDLDNPTPENLEVLEEIVTDHKFQTMIANFVTSTPSYVPSAFNARLVQRYFEMQETMPTSVQDMQTAWESVEAWAESRETVNAERAAYGLPPLGPPGSLPPEVLDPTILQQPPQPRDPNTGRFVAQPQPQPRTVQTGLPDRNGPPAGNPDDEIKRLLDDVAHNPDRDRAQTSLLRAFEIRKCMMQPRQY